MRMRYWSSDVCSSGLLRVVRPQSGVIGRRRYRLGDELSRGSPVARLEQRPAISVGDGRIERYQRVRGGGQPRRRGHIAAPEMRARSEEHTSELQSLMRISYAVFCLKKIKHTTSTQTSTCK